MKKVKVVIEYDNENLSAEQIDSHIAENFYEEEIVSRKDNVLELLLEMYPDEDSSEVENEMFYLLENGKYGKYSYELVK